jgi:hypothetical protein
MDHRSRVDDAFSKLLRGLHPPEAYDKAACSDHSCAIVSWFTTSCMSVHTAYECACDAAWHRAVNCTGLFPTFASIMTVGPVSGPLSCFFLVLPRAHNCLRRPADWIHAHPCPTGRQSWVCTGVLTRPDTSGPEVLTRASLQHSLLLFVDHLQHPHARGALHLHTSPRAWMLSL